MLCQQLYLTCDTHPCIISLSCLESLIYLYANANRATQSLYLSVDVLVLDNTFSWTRGKNVKYSVEVEPVEGDNDSFSSALDIPVDDESINDVLNDNHL